MSINHKTNTGFTLIELLVTISIIVIQTFVGVPTFKSVTNNSRISATNNTLVGNLALARSEAINRNRAVNVCASSNGSSCTGTAWELGWIVFTDGGTAGAVDGSDKILRVQNETIGRLTVTASGPFVRFKPGGETARLETGASRLAGLLYRLMPGTDAWASEGDDSTSQDHDSTSQDHDSTSQDHDSTSQDHDSMSMEHHSGGSGAPLMSCVAPPSAACGCHGDHNSCSSDSQDSTSSSDDNSQDSASSASHSGDSMSGDSMSGDSMSGDSMSGSTASSGSAATATCDGQPLAANSFLICDASKANEIGNLVTVTKTGRISQQKVRCN